MVASLGLVACSSGDSTTSTTTTSATSSGTGGESTGTSGVGGAGGDTGSTATSTATGTGTGTGTGGAAPMGKPIDAPDEEWTWIPFDNAFCGDGSTTGIGVNLTKKSSRVLLYLEGGGACWSDLTCNTLKTASNFTTGFSETNFKNTASNSLSKSFFDRNAADNPFKDYSIVYVPYCTGDIHAGDNTVMYGGKPAKHSGYKNVSAYLERVVPTFPNADRVILSGVSAGGFGAALNWWQTQEAFGKIRVDMLDDSGTPMPPSIPIASEAEWRKQWNLAATFPPGCTECATRIDGILGFYAKIYPDHRGALMSYTKDSVLPTFFGITQDKFAMGLEEQATTQFNTSQNLRYFIYTGTGHVLWSNPNLTTQGVTMREFVTKMVTDDPTWNSVHP
jgi:hypothetical protein